MKSPAIFACPTTGEALAFDRVAGTVVGEKSCSARDHCQAVNESKQHVTGDLFGGPFDPVETDCRRSRKQGLVWCRAAVRIFVPVVVARGNNDGRHDPRLLDRVQRLIQRFGLRRLFPSCQMHLVEKPA